MSPLVSCCHHPVDTGQGGGGVVIMHAAVRVVGGGSGDGGHRHHCHHCACVRARCGGRWWEVYRKVVVCTGKV